MSLEEDTWRKELEIKDLPDQRWYRLMSQRRSFVEQEKQNAVGKQFEVELVLNIQQGYSNLLDCVLDVPK